MTSLNDQTHDSDTTDNNDESDYELHTCDEDNNDDFYDALEDTLDDLQHKSDVSLKETQEIDENDVDLETSWSFYFDRCVRGFSLNEYEANLKFIYKVETVQSFWRVFNNIPDVSALPNRCSYHLMKGSSRKPLWEDEENINGGQWKLKCNKQDTSLVWREVILAAIGEQLSDHVASNDDIIGISVSCREKDDLIQIWNLNAKLEGEANVIKKINDLLPNVKFPVCFYKPNRTEEPMNSPARPNKAKKLR